MPDQRPRRRALIGLGERGNARAARLRRRRLDVRIHLHPFLLGVAAGVIGLIAAVTVHIVDTGVVDVPTALVAVGAFLALNRGHGKLTVV